MSDRKDTRHQDKKHSEKQHFEGRGRGGDRPASGRGGGGGGRGGGRGGRGGVQIAKRGGGGGAADVPVSKEDYLKHTAPNAAPSIQPQAPDIAPLKAGQAVGGDVKPYQVGSHFELESDIKCGDLVVGEMAVLKWTNNVSFLRHPGFLPRDVVIDGSDNRGGALPGDIVAVGLRPRNQWHDVEENAGLLPEDLQKEKHRPILAAKEDGSSAKLEDGRTVRHGLIKDKKAAATAGGADQQQQSAFRRPATRISEDCGAKAPTDWPERRQPIADRVVQVLERRFTKFHPCRLYDDGSDFSNIQANRFYKFRPYDEHYPMLAVYGRNIPTAFHHNIKEYLFMCEILTSSEEKKVEAKHHHGGKQQQQAGSGDQDGPFLPAGSPKWLNNDRFPEAAVLRSLGKQGTAEAESKAIASMCHIRDFEFPPDVEADVMQDFTIPDADELKKMNRRDLRNEEFICTIDPATARDLDDALSCTRVGTGFRVGVHIADVSYFVPHGTALDDEAMARSTSTYLVERVVPMLPRKLSEDYCSLNANSDKFAFSCVWEMDHDANITSEWIGQSVIRNNCRLAYEEAQRILDGDKSGEGMPIIAHNGWTKEEVLNKVNKSVENLHRVSSKLRKKRWERGAVALNRRKIKLHFADKDSMLAPAAFSLESSIDANWVVEELMLLANCRVAEKICEYIPDAGLVRQHSPPQKKKVGPTVRAAAKHGYQIEAGTSSQLAASLERYKDCEDSDVIRSMCTYCMSLAKYVSSGVDDEIPISHYALAMSCYTHFTSPIRRYADLMVHRQLLLALELESLVKKKAEEDGVDVSEVKLADLDTDDLQYGYAHKSHEQLATICEHMNDSKQNARNAGGLSTKSFFCYYLEALKQQSKMDPKVPAVLTSAAVCTKVSKKAFVMYSRETTMEVEIFHNAQVQQWVEPNRVNEADGKFIINWGKLPAGKKLPKGFKAASLEEYNAAAMKERKKKGEEDKKGGDEKPKVPQGLPPELLANLPGLPPGAIPVPIQAPTPPEDCVLEDAGLFFNAVITINITHGAMIGIDYIVEPPWNRESRTGVPMSLSGESPEVVVAAIQKSREEKKRKQKEEAATLKALEDQLVAPPTAGGVTSAGMPKRGVFEEDDDE